MANQSEFGIGLSIASRAQSGSVKGRSTQIQCRHDLYIMLNDTVPHQMEESNVEKSSYFKGPIKTMIA